MDNKQQQFFLQNKLPMVTCLHDFFFSVLGLVRTLSLQALYFSAFSLSSLLIVLSALLSITL